jgi:pantothenate kinase
MSVSSTTRHDDNKSVDEAMRGTYSALAETINEQYNKWREDNPARLFLVGIVGPPGAGKSTTTAALKGLVPKSEIVPMDGYHFTKERLSQFPNASEAFARRGAEWTFDGERFVADIRRLKETSTGQFPSFDHGVGDPVENAISIDSTRTDIVFVEGNYLLLPEQPWSALKDEAILDFFIFIRASEETVRRRVFNRHVLVGSSPEIAQRRVDTNDWPNAVKILDSASRADVVVNSI